MRQNDDAFHQLVQRVAGPTRNRFPGQHRHQVRHVVLPHLRKGLGQLDRLRRQRVELGPELLQFLHQAVRLGNRLVVDEAAPDGGHDVLPGRFLNGNQAQVVLPLVVAGIPHRLEVPGHLLAEPLVGGRLHQFVLQSDDDRGLRHALQQPGHPLADGRALLLGVGAVVALRLAAAGDGHLAAAAPAFQ
nr:hypothetical protein [Rhodovulum steppense]